MTSFSKTTVHPRTSQILRLRRVRLRPGYKRLRSGLGGFSFAEVMFAVVILGIGFILISAVFPIAAEQSRSTTDESKAATLASGAIKTIQSCTTTDDFPDTQGVMRPFSDVNGLWEKVSASAIDPNDARYAWVPFYSRNGDNGLVTISVLVVRRWLHDVYSNDDLAGDLLPRGISIMGITPTGDGTLTARIARDPLGMYQCVTDGSFLIMRSGDGDISGRRFKVSHYRTEDADSVYYILVPGDGLAFDESCGSASAAVIGRDYADLTNSNAGYAGPSQDVAVYTTIMRPN